MSSQYNPPLGRRSDCVIVAPDGSEVRLLLTEEHRATRCSMVEVYLEPGAVSRPVRHRTVEEAWYVIEGEGEVWRCHPDVPIEHAPGGQGVDWGCVGDTDRLGVSVPSFSGPRAQVHLHNYATVAGDG